MTLMSEFKEDRRKVMEALAKIAGHGVDVSKPLAMAAARVQVDECHACPLGDETMARVPFEGGPSSIMFVGEAPGAREDEMEQPFVGRSGDLLNDLLTKAGMARVNVAVANTICCRPRTNDYEYAREVGAPDACRPHLTRALETSGAWIVISVGGKAAAEFDWHGTVGAAVGKWRWRDGRLHTTIWHPSYLLRRGGMSSKEADHNVEVLDEARRASQGMGRYTPKAPFMGTVLSSIRADGSPDTVRNLLVKPGWAPLWSNVLSRNVILYNPDVVDMPSRVHLPPGMDDPVWFTVDELARLKRYDDVRHVAALKDVLPLEVVG